MRQFDVAFFAASVDDPETNRRFAESLELDYPLLSDPEKQTARAYGVLNGSGELARRHTFYIGADGKILFIDREVQPLTAGEDLVRRLESLGLPRRKGP